MQQQNRKPLEQVAPREEKQQKQLRKNPRKLSERFGFEALSTDELLAVILRSGTAKKSVYEIAKRAQLAIQSSLQENFDTERFLNSCSSELPQSPAFRASIASLYEFIRRKICTTDARIRFSTPQKIVQDYEFLARKQQEFVYGVYLSPDLTLKKSILLAKGTIDYVLLEPSDVFYYALKYRSRNVVLVHNHPSGNFQPSDKDIEHTKKLSAAADLMHINLLDHLIVTWNGYYSFKESKHVL